MICTSGAFSLSSLREVLGRHRGSALVITKLKYHFRFEEESGRESYFFLLKTLGWSFLISAPGAPPGRVAETTFVVGALQAKSVQS